MEARIIPGPKPSVIDAMIEAEKRGLGKLQADWFVSGVLKGNGYPIAESPGRPAVWIEQGSRWAIEEIARRAAESEK